LRQVTATWLGHRRDGSGRAHMEGACVALQQWLLALAGHLRCHLLPGSKAGTAGLLGMLVNRGGMLPWWRC